MELKFDREQNRMDRLTFIRRYNKWVKSVPYEVWSRQQVAGIADKQLSEQFKEFSTGPARVSGGEGPFKSSHNPDE